MGMKKAQVKHFEAGRRIKGVIYVTRLSQKNLELALKAGYLVCFKGGK